jgi:hypothetical protein
MPLGTALREILESEGSYMPLLLAITEAFYEPSFIYLKVNNELVFISNLNKK